jgi:manganese/iron transport system permease protein
MVLAPCLGVAAAVAGLTVSQHVRAAAGATIVLVAAALFGLSLLLAPRHGLVSRLWRGRPPSDREAVSGDAPGHAAAPAAR